jgi:hypothetical protein
LFFFLNKESRLITINYGKNKSPTFFWYHTDRIENEASNNSSIVAVYLLPRQVFAKPLSSNDREIHVQTHRLVGGIN